MASSAEKRASFWYETTFNPYLPLTAAFSCVGVLFCYGYNDPIGFQVQHGEELEQLKRDMAVVLQASLGAAPSPSKDDSNVQQLKQRIKELEGDIEELNNKYNEELKTERVRGWQVLSVLVAKLG